MTDGANWRKALIGRQLAEKQRHNECHNLKWIGFVVTVVVIVVVVVGVVIVVGVVGIVIGVVVDANVGVTDVEIVIINVVVAVVIVAVTVNGVVIIKFVAAVDVANVLDFVVVVIVVVVAVALRKVFVQHRWKRSSFSLWAQTVLGPEPHFNRKAPSVVVVT